MSLVLTMLLLNDIEGNPSREDIKIYDFREKQISRFIITMLADGVLHVPLDLDIKGGFFWGLVYL